MPNLAILPNEVIILQNYVVLPYMRQLVSPNLVVLPYEAIYFAKFSGTSREAVSVARFKFHELGQKSIKTDLVPVDVASCHERDTRLDD